MISSLSVSQLFFLYLHPRNVPWVGQSKDHLFIGQKSGINFEDFFFHKQAVLISLI